jgi:ribosomal protein L37AE/L43A
MTIGRTAALNVTSGLDSHGGTKALNVQTIFCPRCRQDTPPVRAKAGVIMCTICRHQRPWNTTGWEPTTKMSAGFTGERRWDANLQVFDGALCCGHHGALVQ